MTVRVMSVVLWMAVLGGCAIESSDPSAPFSPDLGTEFELDPAERDALDTVELDRPLPRQRYLDGLPVGGPISAECPAGNDSDGDGLANLEEVETDPCNPDTDGDSISDFIESAYDPACAVNARCQPPASFHAVVVPHDSSGLVDVPVRTQPRQVDVLVLSDATDEVALRADELRAVLDPTRLETGDLNDSTFVGHAFARGWNAANPFPPLALRAEPHAQGELQLSSMFDALDEHRAGGDQPAYARTLRDAILRPAPVRLPDGSLADLSADCAADRVGGACFREHALPIIVHFASDDVKLLDPTLRSEVLSAFAFSGARYVGMHVGDTSCGAGGCQGMDELARSVGSMGPEEAPLVMDFADQPVEEMMAKVPDLLYAAVHLTRTRVFARLGDSVPFEVTIRACNPLRSGETCIEPMGDFTIEESVQEVERASYVGVLPGTRVRFSLEVDNAEVAANDVSQRYELPLEVIGDGRVALDEASVHILVPARR